MFLEIFLKEILKYILPHALIVNCSYQRAAAMTGIVPKIMFL